MSFHHSPKRRFSAVYFILICAVCLVFALTSTLVYCIRLGRENTKMTGAGTSLTCKNCEKTHQMNEYGQLISEDGDTKFSHIPDWYAWQRACVKEEILSDKYALDSDVDIGIMTDFKAIYMIGEGHLTHDKKGFTLTSKDGKLQYEQSPLSSYGLYSDYFWYEIGDVICIGDRKILYYCFPKKETNVTKARLAAEEIYKLKKNHDYRPCR